MSTRTPQQRMTKHELAKQVAAGADLTGEQAKSAVDIAIAGFAKSVSERAAREGTNPATAQTIQIAASRAARFSTAAALNQQLTADRGRAAERSVYRGCGPMPGRSRAGPRRGASINRPAAVIFHARVEPAATSTRPWRSSSTSACVTRAARPCHGAGHAAAICRAPTAWPSCSCWASRSAPRTTRCLAVTIPRT